MSRPHISFEYFPPRTQAGRDRLLGETTPALNLLGPEFFSCTYGAGGSTRDNTFDIVSSIKARAIDIAPHLSFGGGDENAIGELLDRYVDLGINRLVALRGDVPSGTGGANLVYARELIEFVRHRHGDHFTINVAAYPEIHPEAKGYEHDIAFLKGKFEAGADAGITQYFYNADAYFYFVDRCLAAGIDRPIYAGVMPITHYGNLARFSRHCGAEIPRWICQRLADYGDDTGSIHRFGIEVVSRLTRTLIDNGCPGIHFYTMNQVEPTRTIYNNLGL